MIKALTQNWSAKLLSLLLALILWFFITGEQTSEIGFAIPLELKNIPKGMMVVNEVPNVVDVRVSGPRTILSNLRPSDYDLTIDLKDTHPGVTSFVRLENRIQVPSALKITRLSPSILDVRLEKIFESTVPVKAVTTGSLPKGYQLSGMLVTPPVVTIQGPRAEIRGIREVLTEAINVGTATESFTARTPLNFSGKLTTLKDVREVEVRINLLKLSVQEEKPEKSEMPEQPGKPEKPSMPQG